MATKVIFEDVDHPQFNTSNQANNSNLNHNQHQSHGHCHGHGHGHNHSHAHSHTHSHSCSHGHSHQHGISHPDCYQIKMENNSDHFDGSQHQSQSHGHRVKMKREQNMINHNNNNNNLNYNDSNSKLITRIKHESMQHQQQKQQRKRIFVSYHNKQKGIFGCKHYARNCFLKADCCNQWYVCRFCHDERNEDSTSINGGMPHQINRYATKYCKCMRCGEEQPISQHCRNCTVQMIVKVGDENGVGPPSNTKQNINIKQENKVNKDHDNDDNDDDIDGDLNMIKKEEKTKVVTRPYSFGRYYCDICKFHDDNPKKEIFHCLECGLCRLGRQTDYIHCQRCGCCLNYKYYAKHPCIENSLKSDCPICFQYLFKSREPVTFFMPCGHPIHYDCLLQYAKAGNWKCPICRIGWYDEQSEKRKKIVQAIKGMNKHQNIVLHQNSNINNRGHGIIITNPAAHTSNNNLNQSPTNVHINQLMSPSPAPSNNHNNNNHNNNQQIQQQHRNNIHIHQQMQQQK